MAQDGPFDYKYYYVSSFALCDCFCRSRWSVAGAL